MEVVARDVARRERRVEHRVVVEEARIELRTHIGELRVERDVPLPHRLATLDVRTLRRRRVGEQ